MYKFIGNVAPYKYELLDKKIEFCTSKGSDFYGIRYFNTKSKILESLYNLIPKEVHEEFYASLLIINDCIPPHTDIVDQACLNCYVEPAGYITTFYENSLCVSGNKFSNRHDGCIYEKSALTKVSSFQAKPFEVYLLNNRAIHEVSIVQDVKPVRKVLQLATNKYSFDDVSKMLPTIGINHVL